MSFFLVRDSDGIPLAKGKSRQNMEPMRQVFASLGVPCSVRQRHRRGVGWREGESIMSVRQREREREQRIARIRHASAQ